MPDPYPPSQFGGKAQRNGIQPPTTPDGRPGHELTPSEEHRLLMTTGQTEDTGAMPDQDVWDGLLPLSETEVPADPAARAVAEWNDRRGVG